MPDTTVVFCPRERHSPAPRALASLLRHSPGNIPLVMVDCLTPPAILGQLSSLLANRPGVQWLRLPGFHYPHQIYNKALELLSTEFVAFVDNDIELEPGWLANLHDCLIHNNAAIAAPVFLQQQFGATTIHMAGGSLRIEDNRLLEQHTLEGRPPAHLDSLPEDFPSDLFEYHAFLARTEILRKIGGFDEALTAAGDIQDTSLRLQQINARICMTRRTRVLHHMPPPLEPVDFPFYFRRWSETALQQSRRHFAAKWNVHPFPTAWHRTHRQLCFLQCAGRLAETSLSPSPASSLLLGKILRKLLGPLEAAWNRHCFPD